MEAFEAIVLMIAGSLVLMILSFLYRDSRWFTLAETVIVGGLAGQGTAIGLKNIWTQGMMPLLEGQLIYILAIVCGLLLFAKYFDNVSWLVRIPTAVLVGTGIGLNMRAGIETQITMQIADTIKSFTAGSLMTNINVILVIIGVSCVTAYFTFTYEEGGIMKPASTVGRYFLMIGLGSSFAFAVLGRTSLLISRVSDLLSYPTYFLVPIAIAIIVYDIYQNRKTP